MKKCYLACMVLLILLFCSSPGFAEFKMVMKFASATAPEHSYNVGARKFIELIEEKTNGRIRIKLYPALQLGKGEREMLEGVQQGAIALLITSTGPLGGFSPSINILDFPFLFRDFKHADQVLDGAIGKKLLNDFEKVDVKGLAFWENGFRHLSNSKLPVKNVKDGKGLKIRTMENKVHLAAWRSAGFLPTPMAWGEVFTAMQQGVIDGQENPIAIYYATKLWDARQKYLSLTAHVYSPAPLLMSKKIFDSMPADDQALFLKTAQEVSVFQRGITRETEESWLQEIAAKGVYVVRDVDRDSLKEAMEPVFNQFSNQFPKAEIESIRNAR